MDMITIEKYNYDKLKQFQHENKIDKFYVTIVKNDEMNLIDLTSNETPKWYEENKNVFADFPIIK